MAASKQTCLPLFYTQRELHRFNAEESDIWLAEYLRYAFAFQSNAGFCEWSNKCGIPMDRSTLSASTRSNGKLLLDLKGFTFLLHSDQFSSDLSSFDISQSDKTWVKRALNGPGRKLLRGGLTGLIRDGYTPISGERAQEMMAEALTSEDLRSYFGKFINRKLSFLQSYGHTPQSLFAFLIESAVYSMLRVFPKWTDVGFLLSVAKNAGKRAGLNLIDSETTQKRQALIRETNGFSSVVVSFDLLMDNGFDPSYQGSSLAPQPRFESDTVNALRSLANDRRFLSDDDRQFLRLLMGEHDDAFSAFLGGDNDDLAEAWSFDKYQRRVCQFLGRPVAHSQEFLSSLRGTLS